MREPFLKLLHSYIMQIMSLMAGIEFYGELIADIEKQKAKVEPIWKEFRDQSNDQEYVGKLTVEEQRALGSNEISYKKLLREMDESITHLMSRKYTQDILRVQWITDDLRIFIEALLDCDCLTEVGTEIKVKTLVNPDKFAKADYMGRIAITQTVIDTVKETILEEGVFGDHEDVPHVKFYLKAGLGKSIRVLQQDLEYAETNGLPEPWQFEVPEIVVPEIPEEAPEPEDPQMEVKFPDAPPPEAEDEPVPVEDLEVKE